MMVEAFAYLVFTTTKMKPHEYTYETEVHVIDKKSNKIKSLTPIKTKRIVNAQKIYVPLSINLKQIKAPKNQKINVYFDFDSYQIRKDQIKKLNSLPFKSVKLKGMASPEGTEEYNLKLSEKRAKSVKTFIEKKGIKVKQITALGEKACKLPKEQYEKCRKVEIINDD